MEKKELKDAIVTGVAATAGVAVGSLIVEALDEPQIIDVEPCMYGGPVDIVQDEDPDVSVDMIDIVPVDESDFIDDFECVYGAPVDM